MNLKSTLTVIAIIFAFQLNAQTWTTNGSSAICKTNGNNVRITVKRDGSVWIGDSTGTQKSSSTLLYVDGTMKSREIIVNMSNWPDYVFDSTYILMPMDSLTIFIDSAGHLPNVPSRNEVVSNGMSVSQMNEVMMRKIEELQLYILQLNARIKELEKQN
jgi:hypothetical protein